MVGYKISWLSAIPDPEYLISSSSIFFNAAHMYTQTYMQSEHQYLVIVIINFD